MTDNPSMKNVQRPCIDFTKTPLVIPPAWLPERLTRLYKDPAQDAVDETKDDAAPERFLSVAEVAKELRASKKTVYRLLEEGALPAVQFKPGSPYLIERAELEAYIASRRTTPGPHDIEPWQS